jgi:hypothetical protein
MTKLMRTALQSLLFLCLATISTNAQTDNLLQNPKADLEAQHWRAVGQAAIEEVNGNRRFVVRNGGYFLQDVILPESAAGQYAVFIGSGSSERINSDGAITGLPYLYGYMMAPGRQDSGRILAYLQGQQMRSAATFVGEWVKMWGIFKVPEGTERIRFFLNQAERRGVPHNGSAARFDDLGLYLFPTEEEARSFADSYY